MRRLAGFALTVRRHVDLQRVTAAACRLSV
jgi:hypothetical protein